MLFGITTLGQQAMQVCEQACCNIVRRETRQTVRYTSQGQLPSLVTGTTGREAEPFG